MIISGLPRVLVKYNLHHPHDKIPNANQLYKKMDKRGLHVSRPTLIQLLNDNPAKHKSHIYKSPQNIKFSVLNNLVKFFNVPVGELVQFIGNATDIQALPSYKFLDKHGSDLKNLEPLIINGNLQTCRNSMVTVIITDRRKYTKSDNKPHKWYLFLNVREIPTSFNSPSIQKSSSIYYFSPVNLYCNDYLKSDKEHYSDVFPLVVLGYILGALSKSRNRREYLDNMIIQSCGFGKFPHKTISVINGLNRYLGGTLSVSDVPNFNIDIFTVGKVKKPTVSPHKETATDYSFRFLN